MNNVEDIRESFYSIKIGDEPEFVWIKKLRNILNSDIHDRPLGCKIDHTHIKIGNVHLGSFYEAQLLFSHSKWIHRFAEWLFSELNLENENCLVVGYETYIEPVLSILRNKTNNETNFDYCIYEEPKYIQRNTMSKARLRYSECINRQHVKKKYQKVVFLCGISSTLSTYKKLKDFFVEVLKDKEQKIDYLYYSIIQVLPRVPEGENEFILNDACERLVWDKNTKKVYRDNDFSVQYLVDVECEWQMAQNCKWCFPQKSFLDERPLVTTGESSVIPLQMIGLGENYISKKNYQKFTDKDGFNFFKKERGRYKYLDYLYYNHIDRDDHHFQYYIRTGSLFNTIMDDETSQEFIAFCNEIKRNLQLDEKSINIIVTPLHFSNERFSHEINRLVFDNRAHIISFDSRKEYRSNFETKYSNYAYVLDQINSAAASNNVNFLPQINFYFVDDQLITGNTFYKAKSFSLSLMRKYSNSCETSKRFNVFSAVITLLDRNSKSTKLNYVEKEGRFFSFINIPIPSIRSYGDSCPLCKQVIDAQNISNNCTLDTISKHWEEKAHYHKEKTIEKAKELSQESHEYVRTRHFIRFYCECALWNNIKNLWDEEGILYNILLTIYQEIKSLDARDQYEFLISFLKVISRPFLFYRENVKKAVLKILLLILDETLNEKVIPNEIIEATFQKALEYKYIVGGGAINKKKKSKKTISEDIEYEQYCLICVIISCLSNVESSYLLSVEHISRLCDFIYNIDKSYLTFGKIIFFQNREMYGFYSVIANNFKKLICGTSGMEKSKYIEKDFFESFNHKYGELFKVLYLENIRFSNIDRPIDERIKNIQKNQDNTISKYEKLGSLCKENIKVDSCLFFLSYGQHLEKSKIAEIFGNTRIGDYHLIFEKIKYNIKDTASFYDNLNKLGYIEINHQYFLILLTNSSEKVISDKIVLMLLSFASSDANNYTAVKKWLIHRKRIKEIVEGDIRTGALETAIRAKAAEYVLSTDKTQSHGQSNDINKLFEFIYEKFIALRNTEQITRAYQGINLFINRCIAFGATKQIFQEYFDLTNLQPQLQPFNACVQRVINVYNKECVVCDLRKYFEEITNKNSSYINEIKEEVLSKRYASKGSKEQQVSISLDDSFFEYIGRIEYVPLFINLPATLADSAIFLIGIVDVFIRNAIEHGSDDCNIEIKCKMGTDVVEEKLPNYTYNNSYSISVINDCGENEQFLGGFTQKFFTQYLLREKDKHCYFYVTMNKISLNKFESIITCIIKDILEEL